MSQVWTRILGDLQETFYAKCDFSILVDPGDAGVIHNLGICFGSTGRPKIGHSRCS